MKRLACEQCGQYLATTPRGRPAPCKRCGGKVRAASERILPPGKGRKPRKTKEEGRELVEREGRALIQARMERIEAEARANAKRRQPVATDTAMHMIPRGRYTNAMPGGTARTARWDKQYRHL